MKRRLSTLADTRNAALELYAHLAAAAPVRREASVVGLYGNLGAGKTAFAKLFAEILGVAETVTSPTFVIEKIYVPTGDAKELFDHFIHIDAYRLEDSEELVRLGWNEIIADPKNLIFIEWPERVASVMPPHARVMLSLSEDDAREIRIDYA